MNEVIKNIKERRSVRKYTDKEISESDIKEIIESGRYAPSAHNRQSWRFVVVQGKGNVEKLVKDIKGYYNRILWLMKVSGFFNKGVKKIADDIEKRINNKNDLLLYDAPLVMFVFGKKDNFSVKDCSCAAQNMMLAARSLGIGSCWIDYATIGMNMSSGLKKKYGIKGKVHGTLVFGYPVKFPGSALPRNEKSNVVKWVK